MRYYDKLYGEIHLPDYMDQVIETRLFRRLHDVATSPLPRGLSTHPHASRFEHSIGVCHLMNLAVQANSLRPMESLLLTSALLHDAGNPPFAHLSEPILRKVTGKNGESFLRDTIQEFAPNGLFESLGTTTEDILEMVTGNKPPLSNLLHGSMDVDNLDNVGRYWFTCTGGEKPFNGEAIASAYRLGREVPCYLPFERMVEARKWQDTRALVYRKVYDEPDLGGAMMIFRAMDLAHKHGEITEDFFYLSDIEAMGFLSRCNARSAFLVRQAVNRQWYKMVYAVETKKPSEKLIANCDNVYDTRSTVADQLAEKFKIPPHAVCVYVGKGRGVRTIHLPFVRADKSLVKDERATKQTYRFKVYVAPEYTSKALEVGYWAENLLR